MKRALSATLEAADGRRYGKDKYRWIRAGAPWEHLERKEDRSYKEFSTFRVKGEVKGIL